MDDEATAARAGLGHFSDSGSNVAPEVFRDATERLRMKPDRSVGLSEKSSLKACLWEHTLPECDVPGDPAYVCVVLHLGGGRVRRNNLPTAAEIGSVGMLPFEGARWHFEAPVRFAHFFLPFAFVDTVCADLVERELGHEQLWVPTGTRDPRLCSTLETIRTSVSSTEPTHLLLDSWALLVSEILLRRFSSHAPKNIGRKLGKLPPWGIARAVDYIEAHIDQDLSLTALAAESAMSVYHFARRFKQTVGLSPHAYVVSRRVRRAQEMLRQGKSTLAQVAAACGFSSQAHLTTLFRRQLGVTPGKYQRPHRRRIA